MMNTQSSSLPPEKRKIKYTKKIIIDCKKKTSNAARDHFVDYSFDLKKFIRSKDEKTRENVSDLFDIILQKHVRIIKQIKIPHKLDDLFF